ncbi:hypothetical protein [Stenotrophomonas phage CM2]
MKTALLPAPALAARLVVSTGAALKQRRTRVVLLRCPRQSISSWGDAAGPVDMYHYYRDAYITEGEK